MGRAQAAGGCHTRASRAGAIDSRGARLRPRLAAVTVLAVLAAMLATASAAAERTDDENALTLAQATEIWRGSVHNGTNGLYVGPDGNVYTASVFGNEIVVQHPKTGEVLDRIGPERGVNGPDDVFVTDDGTLYWTDILGGTVGMLKPDGTHKTQFVGPGVNPITMSDNGRLFVALVFLGVGLFELDPELTEAPVPVFPVNPAAVTGLNGMDFGPDGKLYGPLFFSGAVARIDVLNRTAGVDPAVEIVADGFRVPSAVKFDSKGRLHVSDLAEGQIIRVDLAKNKRKVVADIDGIIDNLAFDAKDRLFFAADGDAQVLRVKGRGKVKALNKAGFSGPSTIAQTDDGTIWVADGGELRGFTSDRAPSSTIYFRFDPPFGGPAGANSVAPAGDHLITTGFISQAIQVIDPGTGAILEDHRPLPAAVNAIAHGDTLVAAQLGVGVIDVRTGVVLDPNYAYPLGLASDGETLYVSDWVLGTITAITPAGSHPVAAGFANPEGLALHGHHLLVVEEGADRVSAVDLRNGEVKTLIVGLDLGFVGPVSPFSLPHGNLSGAMVADDGVYVSQDGATNALYRFN